MCFVFHDARLNSSGNVWPFFFLPLERYVAPVACRMEFTEAPSATCSDHFSQPVSMIMRPGLPYAS